MMVISKGTPKETLKEIHKIAAMVISSDKKTFLMVRKKDKDIWTNLGGHPENNETEIETLLREILEETGSNGEIIKKLGDFRAPAALDSNSIVNLSTYLVKLDGPIDVSHDPEGELAEYRFIGKDYKENGIKLPQSIEGLIIPYCIENGLLEW